MSTHMMIEGAMKYDIVSIARRALRALAGFHLIIENDRLEVTGADHREFPEGNLLSTDSQSYFGNFM